MRLAVRCGGATLEQLLAGELAMVMDGDTYAPAVVGGWASATWGSSCSAGWLPMAPDATGAGTYAMLCSCSCSRSRSGHSDNRRGGIEHVLRQYSRLIFVFLSSFPL